MHVFDFRAATTDPEHLLGEIYPSVNRYPGKPINHYFTQGKWNGPYDTESAAHEALTTKTKHRYRSRWDIAHPGCSMSITGR